MRLSAKSTKVETLGERNYSGLRLLSPVILVLVMLLTNAWEVYDRGQLNDKKDSTQRQRREMQKPGARPRKHLIHIASAEGAKSTQSQTYRSS
jgi:hypothetical protein